MKRSFTFGLRLFTFAFLVLFTFAQPLLTIEAFAVGDPLNGAVGIVTDTSADPTWGSWYLRYTGNPAPSSYSHAYQWENPAYVCDPNNTPTVFTGAIDVNAMPVGSVSMVGLIDKGILDIGKTGYQSGAYAYIYRISADSVRIGPSDGNLGGEIVRNFRDYSVSSTNGILNLSMTISDENITLAIESDSPISDIYGAKKGTYSYAWDEFSQGAIPGWDNFGSNNMPYDFTVSGCIEMDRSIEMPVHISPLDESYRTTISQALIDWTDVTDPSTPVSYLYQSSSSNNLNTDGSFVSPVYTSSSLSVSEISTSGTPEGEYYWHVKAIDAQGNQSPWTTPWKVTIDNTAPSIPQNLRFSDPVLTCGAFTNIGINTVDWDDSTDNFALDGYDYNIDYPLSTGRRGIWNAFFTNSQYRGNLNEGLHQIKIRAKDKAGNVSDWTSLCDITYDKTAPTTPTNLYFRDIDNGQDLQCGGYSNTKHISEYWDASEDANLDHYEYSSYNAPDGAAGLISSIMSSNFFNSSWWTIPSEGTYGFQVRAVDKAGNMSEWALGNESNIANSCEINIDWEKPTVNLVFDTPSPDAKGFKAIFNEDMYQADAENPANYFLNNWPTAGGTGDLLGDASIAYDSTTHTATVTFTNGGWYISPEQQWGIQDIHDLAGNILTVTPYTEYSTPMLAPVTTTTGIDSLWHNADVTVNLVCTDIDGSGCYKTHYSVNGSADQIGNSVLVSTEGLNTITYYSEDMAGNVEVVHTSEVIRIDKTNPTADVLSTLSFTTGDTTPRSLALNDNNELEEVCYVIDTNTQTCLPLFGTGYSWNITNLINTLGIGSHTFTYYVIDTAGNRSDSDIIIEGDDPYASSVTVAAVPQDTEGLVQGTTTRNNTLATAPFSTELPQKEETPAAEEISTDDTEEVQGAQDTIADDTDKKGIQWWVYVLGGATLLSFLIFLIARSKNKGNEY